MSTSLQELPINVKHLLINHKTANIGHFFFKWEHWHAQLAVLAELHKGKIFKEKRIDILRNRDW